MHTVSRSSACTILARPVTPEDWRSRSARCANRQAPPPAVSSMRQQGAASGRSLAVVGGRLLKRAERCAGSCNCQLRMRQPLNLSLKMALFRSLFTHTRVLLLSIPGRQRSNLVRNLISIPVFRERIFQCTILVLLVPVPEYDIHHTEIQ